MNSEIRQFISEMRDLTGETFQYGIYYWAHSSGREEPNYTIYSSLKGFTGVQKDTEEEILHSLDLIRRQVNLLVKSKELGEQLSIKHINFEGGSKL